MKKTTFILAILVFAGAIAVISYFYKENQEVTRVLNQERYSRMVAEEELQKGDYRIKKLGADLQTTQVKLSRAQESLDREREEKSGIKTEFNKLSERKDSLEKNLKSALDMQETLQARADSAVRAENLAAAEVAKATAEALAEKEKAEAEAKAAEDARKALLGK